LGGLESWKEREQKVMIESPDRIQTRTQDVRKAEKRKGESAIDAFPTKKREENQGKSEEGGISGNQASHPSDRKKGQQEMTLAFMS